MVGLPNNPRHYTLKRFDPFCRERLGLRLYPEQRKILRDHFSGTRQLLVVIPKKNGKTTLLAALALFHLLCFRDTAEVLIVAASERQARRLFDDAGEMARLLDDVFDVKSGYLMIWLKGGTSTGPKIAVKPADPRTLDGARPTLALVDELHRHRDLQVYSVLRHGLLGSAQMITISTAGAGENNPLWMLRAQVLEAGAVRKGAYVRASSGPTVLHEWSLTDQDDLTDMKIVKMANPAPMHTIASLRERYEDPLQVVSPQDWARFACGIWTYGATPWINAPDWDRLAVDIGRVEPGEQVVAHVSTGSGGCAVVVAAQRDDAVGVHAAILTGDVPLEAVEQLCLEVAGDYDVRELSYDRVEFQRSAELLSQRGIPVIEQPHSAERLSIASATLGRYVRAGKLFHDGDPALRAQVLSGTTKDTQRGWHIVKTPNTRALVALAFAVHQATQIPPEVPRYEVL